MHSTDPLRAINKRRPINAEEALRIREKLENGEELFRIAAEFGREPNDLVRRVKMQSSL
jgi:hypothetical protein